MEDQTTVIYVAGSMQQAHMLKNLLAEQGIQSFVINDTLEKGSGIDYVGWNTAPRVVVDQKDATVARRIALEHDRRGAEMAKEEPHQNSMFDKDTPNKPNGMPDLWPRCPDCDKPRITRCPICKTTGTDFTEADDEFVWGMGLDEVAEETSEESSCSACGSCHAHASESEAEEENEPFSPTADADSDEGHAEPDHLILMCPMCSEPFIPEFPKQCAWCGHEFEDGFESEEIVRPLPDSDSRVVAIIVGLLVLLVVVVGYFVFVVGR